MAIFRSCCHNLPSTADMFILGHLNRGPESHGGKLVINVRFDWEWHSKINMPRHSLAFIWASMLHGTPSHSQQTQQHTQDIPFHNHSRAGVTAKRVKQASIRADVIWVCRDWREEGIKAPSFSIRKEYLYTHRKSVLGDQLGGLFKFSQFFDEKIKEWVE